MLRILIIFILISFSSHSQKLNRFDKKGQRTGKWITYNGTKKLSECKYRNGYVVGKAKYYTMDGELEKQEVTRFKKIRTTTYHVGTNVVRSRGSARIVITPDKVHYYYYGKWKYYDEKGEHDRNCYFEKGNLVRTERLKKGKFNDSLAHTLQRIDEYFQRMHLEMIDSVNYSWSGPKLSEKYRNRIYQSDSMVFKKIENVIFEFGYPEKEICGESASGVPFYVMSYAPLQMREKYLELFKAAAGTGQLSKISLAYYIDKIRVAKGEKQIYGTQFKLENKQPIFYPIEDPANVNKRRHEMGFSESEDFK